MRNILVLFVALVACDSPSSSNGLPDTCGDAWVRFCDVVFDCSRPQPEIGDDGASYVYGHFGAGTREKCYAAVGQEKAWTPHGFIGCGGLTEQPGWASCYAATSQIECFERPDFWSADIESTFPVIEACQLH